MEKKKTIRIMLTDKSEDEAYALSRDLRDSAVAECVHRDGHSRKDLEILISSSDAVLPRRAKRRERTDLEEGSLAPLPRLDDLSTALDGSVVLDDLPLVGLLVLGHEHRKGVDLCGRWGGFAREDVSVGRDGRVRLPMELYGRGVRAVSYRGREES